MKRLHLFVTAGLSMLVFLPEATAGGRMSRMMARPPMVTNSSMSGRMMTPNMMTPNMMTGNMMTGNMMGGRMMNGNMNGMMNGNMTGHMTGNMTGMMNGNMTGTTITPFGFPNGFGGFGNQGFGFP